jgi:hypothetical protein
MSLDQDEIEAAVHAVAPRVTLADVEAEVKYAAFARGTDLLETENGVPQEIIDALGCLTICVVITHSGFTITGTSACVSPENYNEDLGRRIAREEAVDKLWGFEGYVLRKSLALTASGSPEPA